MHARRSSIVRPGAPRKLGHVNCLSVASTATRSGSTRRCSGWRSPTGSGRGRLVPRQHRSPRDGAVDAAAHFHHLAFDTVDIGKMRDLLDHLARHGRWLGWGPARHGSLATSRATSGSSKRSASSSSTATWSSFEDDHEAGSTRTTGTRRTRGARCRRARTSGSIRLRSSGSARAARRSASPCPRPAHDPGDGVHDSAVPGGRASIVPYPPWHYVGDFLVVDYWADPGQAVVVPPRGARPASGCRPLCVRCSPTGSRARSGGGELIDPSRSQYKEVFLVVNALLDGEEVTTCPFIWVDRDFALTRGWIQGFPKKLGSIWITRTFGLDSPADPGVSGRAFGGRAPRTSGASPRRRSRSSSLGGRADPQRPADRQRAPLPAARGRAPRRSRRARARPLA